MDKPSIKEELGKFLVNLTITHIDSWANKQFSKLCESPKSLVCLPMGKNSWAIGTYRLKKLDQFKWMLTKDKKLIHVFYSKSAAILYVTLSRSFDPMMVKLAHQLFNSDQSVANLYEKIQYYGLRIKKASKTTSDFKKHLWLVRLEETKLRFNAAIKELEKNINSAKYIKV